MQSTCKSFEDPTPSLDKSESRKSVDGEAVRVPKLIKPIVEREPELIELYQSEQACW